MTNILCLARIDQQNVLSKIAKSFYIDDVLLQSVLKVISWCRELDYCVMICSNVFCYQLSTAIVLVFSTSYTFRGPVASQ